jgi:hypothetical protein
MVGVVTTAGQKWDWLLLLLLEQGPVAVFTALQ